MTAVDDLGLDRGVQAALGGFRPTDEQLAAVTGPVGPLHVIAGAGSGKTAVMAARIVYLVERHGAAPASILGLTFTNKAAGELKQRILDALGLVRPGLGDQVTVSTYHAFAADLVRAYGVRVGVEPDADLLSEAQQYQILLAVLDTARLDHLEVRTPAPAITKTLALAGACSDHLVTPAKVREHALAMIASAEAGTQQYYDWEVDAARDRAELTWLVEGYAAEKRRRGRIDYGDQVAKAVELVERYPEVAAAIRERYRHVLLDEYQDTNVAQRRLMQQLCPAGASVMAVGDARQAIYAFRGATMYNLLGFAEHFPAAEGPGARPLDLSVNFRSGRRILELANAVIEGIPEERRSGSPLVPVPANGDGAVRAALLSDQFTEAAWVGDQVAAVHAAGLPDGTLPAWRDVAVLVRTKRLLGPLREALEDRGVPVEVVGIAGLLEMPEVVDLVAMLRVIDDPGANISLARLLLGPRWRIGYRHLVRLARWAARSNRGLRDTLAGEDPDPGDVGFALAEALDHLDDVEGLDEECRTRLAAFRAELGELRRLADKPLPDLIQAVLERTGVLAELEASIDRRAVTARQNLTAFSERAATFAPVEGQPSLRAFLTYLDAVESASEAVEATQPAQGDSVKLMTVHQAKGLEFPMVVVVGLSAGTTKGGGIKYGIFPNTRVDDPRRAQGFPYQLREDARFLPSSGGNGKKFRDALDARALEDERRVFYVAVTRAKQLLLLSAAWWYLGSERAAKGPGLFWCEAAEHPAVEVVERASEPAESPLAARLQARRSWPPLARRPGDEADEVFPEGLAAGVELERERPGSLRRRVPDGQEPAFDAAVAAKRGMVQAAAAAWRPADGGRPVPTLLSVSDVVEYASCPERFYWRVVRPLPRRPVPAAADLGSLIHRELEQLFREHARDGRPIRATVPGVPDRPPSLPSGSAPGPFPGADQFSGAMRNFASSRFSAMPAPETEVPVAFRSGRCVVRGRIDAIYRTGGPVEVVDWKTGTSRVGRPESGLDQLALYALALQEQGELPEGGCRLTYCYLGGGEPEEDSRTVGPADLASLREVLDETLGRLADGWFPGCDRPGCATCDPAR